MKNKKRFLRLSLLFMGVFLVFAISCDKDGDMNNNNDQGEIIVNSFRDARDGKFYRTVVIGNQEWMAENLAYAPSSGNYWSYDNDDANVEIYGYLYDWHTALDACPLGWHLPTDDEWIELINYLGDNTGGKLKATGTIESRTGLWLDPNTGATNETGFTGFPGGLRDLAGKFGLIGSYGFWGSATESKDNSVWLRELFYGYDFVGRSTVGKELGSSVRCLRD